MTLLLWTAVLELALYVTWTIDADAKALTVLRHPFNDREKRFL